jgi:tetratricopeptide (TPR) repeat protein
MRAGDLDVAARAFDECLELSTALGDEVHTAAALCGLGEVALALGRFDVAAERLVHALRLYRERNDERDSAECLLALGGVAAGQGKAPEALRLWRAADEIRSRLGATLTPDEKRIEERFLPAVLAELGETVKGLPMGSLRPEDVDAIVADLGAVAITE